MIDNPISVRPARKLIVLLSLTMLVSGCFGKSQDISGLLERARQQLAEGQSNEARVTLQQALKAKPADPVANLEMAQIEDQAGNLSEAVPHYLRAAVPEARQINAQLRVIEILLDSERYTEALGRINTTLGTFPDNERALALRADLEERQNQDLAARNDALTVLKQDALNARALSVLALLDLKRKDGQQALAQVQKGLAAHPDDLRLLRVQAAALLTTDQPEKAAEALRSIIKIAPGNIAAQIALAEIQTQNGRFEDAFQSLKNLVAAEPDNQDIKVALVKFLLQHKKDSDLVAYLQSEIAKNPKTDVYDLLLAEYDRTRGQSDVSEDILKKASARLGPGQDGNAVRVALAKLALAKGDARAASEKLDAVLASDPDNKDGLLTRAVLQMNNGRFAAAVADALRVTRADPVNAQAYQVLATAYVSLGQPRLAIEAMRRAVAAVPGDDQAQMRLATFLQKTGDASEVRGIVARQTLAHPNNADIWVTAAQLATERKDWDQASTAIAHIRGLPGMANTANVLGGILAAAQGDPAASATAFRKLIDTDPNVDAGVIARFASASVALKQNDQASAYLESRVPALNPAAKTAAWTAIMAMQADEGHFEAAQTAYQRAAELEPANLPTLQTYVRILTAQKDFAAAEKAVDAAQAAGAAPDTCASMRGTVQEAKGDLAAALASYKEAYERNPVSVPALNNYASIAADRDSQNTTLLQGLRDKMSGLEQTPDPAIIDTIAWLDYRLHRIPEAKALVTSINAGANDNPQIRFHAAAILLASGDKDAGQAVLDTVKDKQFTGADEARNLSAM